ncbi:MAG: LPXTG cell wall anchor domain-containing protein [Lactobacillus sp.]
MTTKEKKMSKQGKNDQFKAGCNTKKVAAGTASVLLSTGLMMGTNTRSVKADSRQEDRITQVADNSEETPQEIIENITSEETEVDTENLETEDVQVTSVEEESKTVENSSDQTDLVVDEPAAVETKKQVPTARKVATNELKETSENNSSGEEEKQGNDQYADSKIKQEWDAKLTTARNLSQELDTALDSLNAKRNVKNADDVKAWEDEYKHAKEIWASLESHLKGINDLNITDLDTEGTTLEQWKAEKDTLVSDIGEFLSKRNHQLDALLKQLDELGLYDEKAQDPVILKQDLVLTHQDINNITSTVKVPDGAQRFTEKTFKNQFGEERYVYKLEKGKDFIPGDLFTITYTDDSGTLWSYGDTVIKNIEITFSDAEVGKGENWTPSIYFGADPTDGWWYANMTGVTAKITFYDSDGNQIKLNNNAYVSALSLNSYNKTNSHEDFGYEGAELKSDGAAVNILESTVRPHENDAGELKIVHADVNNSEEFPGDLKKYADWDNRGSTTAIYGTGLFRVSGDSIILRSFRANRDGSPYTKPDVKHDLNSKSAWFVWSTDMPKLSIDTTTKDVNWKNYFVPSAVVHYWEDQEGGKELDISSILTGKSGEKIDYSSSDVLKKLEAEGYELVSNGYDENGAPNFATTDGTVHYHIVVKKKAAPQPDPEEPVTPTPDPTPETPTPGHDDPVPTPDPEPETPQPNTPTPEEPTPVTPRPETPKDPDDNAPKSDDEKKDHTDTETEKQNQNKEITQVSSTDETVPKTVSSTQTEVSTVKSNEEETTLPQTGKKDSKILSMVSALLGALGLTALIATRKRKDKE